QQAVVEVEELLFRGHPDVVDANLADYFGSLPHAALLKSVARRVVDRRVLHLIKMWLECPVEETDQRGRRRRTTQARDSRRGILADYGFAPAVAFTGEIRHALSVAGGCERNNPGRSAKCGSFRLAGGRSRP